MLMCLVLMVHMYDTSIPGSQKEDQTIYYAKGPVIFILKIIVQMLTLMFQIFFLLQILEQMPF